MSWMLMRATIAAAILLMNIMNQAHAERRVALVVGNAAYTHATRLNNPVNDARDLSPRLERLGFEVVQALDVGSDSFDAAISTFSRKLSGADLALFFYAGHGLQFNGVNYLLPVDTKIEGEFALRRKAVLAQEIIDQMERAAKVSLVFLDACRNNTLLRDLQQSLPEQTRNAASQRGLARMDPRGSNTLIAFATSPNEVAADGVGRNSPFSTALLKHIETPNISVQDMLTSVAGDVLRETNSVQRPEVLSRLTMRVVLHGKTLPPPVPPPVVVPPPASKELEASIAWDTIKDTCEKDRLTVFRERYGDTYFGDLARLRLADIDNGAFCAKPVAAASPVLAPNAFGLPKYTDTPMPSAPVVDTPIVDAAMIRAIQIELKRVGCLAAPADGKYGEGSRKAAEQFVKLRKIAVAVLAPSTALLDAVTTAKGRVCPLVCDPDEHVEGDRCVENERPAQQSPSKPARPAPQAVAKTAEPSPAQQKGPQPSQSGSPKFSAYSSYNWSSTLGGTCSATYFFGASYSCVDAKGRNCAMRSGKLVCQ